MKTKLTVWTGKTTGLAQKTSCVMAMDIPIRLSDKAGINSSVWVALWKKPTNLDVKKQGHNDTTNSHINNSGAMTDLYNKDA